MLQLKELKKDEFLIKTGSSSGPLFAVYTGILRVSCQDNEGKEKTIDFRSSGELTGIYPPYYDQGKYKTWFTVQALTDCKLIGIPTHFNKTLFSTKESIWDTIEKNIFWERYLKTEKRLRSLLVDDATKRYTDFINEFPDIHESIPLYQIASYLGITSVSLSRIRASISPPSGSKKTQ
jgi:CRP-like cAMP-binding protein